MQKLKGPITAGARNLRLYIDGRHPESPRERQSVPAFCETHKLPRLVVQRAMNGQRQRIDVDLALAIQNATGGIVRWHEWASSTRAIVESAETSGGRPAA